MPGGAQLQRAFFFAARVTQRKSCQLRSMMRARLRRVILSFGQRFTAPMSQADYFRSHQLTQTGT